MKPSQVFKMIIKIAKYLPRMTKIKIKETIKSRPYRNKMILRKYYLKLYTIELDTLEKGMGID